MRFGGAHRPQGFRGARAFSSSDLLVYAPKDAPTKGFMIVTMRNVLTGLALLALVLVLVIVVRVLTR